MSIQSELDHHNSESGFFNKSINIRNANGDAAIPPNAHVRFFDCNIGTLTTLGSNSFCYIYGGTIDTLSPSGGEFHVVDVSTIQNVDIWNTKVYIEGNTVDTQVVNTFKSAGGCRFEVRNVQFSTSTFFDCTDTNIFMYDSSSTCDDGGTVTRGRVFLDNVSMVSNSKGIEFTDKCFVDICGGSYDTATEYAILAGKETRIFCDSEAKLKGYLYACKSNDHSKIDCDNVSFEKNRNGEYHYSFYLTDSSTATVSNCSKVLGTSTPAIYLDGNCYMVAKNCDSIESESSHAVHAKNNSSFEGYNCGKYYSEEDIAIKAENGCEILLNKFDEVKSENKHGVYLSSSNANLMDFNQIEAIHKPGIYVSSGSCRIDNFSLKVKGSPSGIEISNGQVIAKDGELINGSQDGVTMSNSKFSAQDVKEIVGLGNCGIKGSNSQCSLVSVDSVLGEGDDGIKIETGQVFASICDTIKGVNNGVYVSSGDCYLSDIATVQGEGNYGIYNQGNGSESNIKKCASVIGSAIAYKGEDVYGRVNECSLEGPISIKTSGTKLDLTNLTCDGDVECENSHNFYDQNEVDGNFSFSGSLDEINNTEISGNLDGSPHTKLNNSTIDGTVTVDDVHATNTTATNWVVKVGIFQDCDGTCTVSEAAEKFGGGMTINGFSATIIRYANGEILDLATDKHTRIANNEIWDLSEYIDHDYPTSTVP